MQKERYWGLALLSIIWVLIVIIFNAISGRTGTSVTTAMWALIAFYAFTGNIRAIASVAKWISILQVVAGTILLFVLINNTDMQLYLGTPADILFSVGISTFFSVVLYYWANGKENTLTGDTTNKNATEITSSVLIKKSSPEFNTQAYEAPFINNHQIFSPPEPDQSVAAKIVLQHDDRVKAIIEGLDGLPAEVVEQILVEIVNHPNEDPLLTRNRALLKALGRPDMVWNDDIDRIIQECGNADIDDVVEFFRVFPILSQRMAPIEVLRKLITEKVTELQIDTIFGEKKKVVRLGTNTFTLQSHLGQKTFSSLNDVYDYLGTPKNKRR